MPSSRYSSARSRSRRPSAFSTRDLRAERDERGHRVRARDREAARARRRDAADDRRMRLHAVALGRAPEERLVVPVAARVEAEVAADRAHVAQLRRRDRAGGLRERRVLRHHRRMRGDLGERRAGADAEPVAVADLARALARGRARRGPAARTGGASCWGTGRCRRRRASPERSACRSAASDAAAPCSRSSVAASVHVVGSTRRKRGSRST